MSVRQPADPGPNRYSKTDLRKGQPRMNPARERATSAAEEDVLLSASPESKRENQPANRAQR